MGPFFWSAANGGLRDGGLSKSEDIWGKKAFFLRFLDFPGRKKRQEKGEKGRFRPISRRAARQPLSPHLLHPHLRQPNFCVLSHINFPLGSQIGGFWVGAKNRRQASITWCDLFWPKFGQKMPKIITSHDVLEPLKQVLSTSRDVIISGQFAVQIAENVSH